MSRARREAPQSLDALRAANERLRAVLDLQIELAGQRDPLRLLAHLCDGARRPFRARHALAFLRPGAGEPAHCLTSGYVPEAAAALDTAPIEPGVFRAVLEKGRSLRLANRRGRRIAGLPAAHPPVHALLAAPIASDDTVHGWLALLERDGAEGFDTDDEALLTALCALAGCAYASVARQARLQSRAAEQQQALSLRLVEVQEGERRKLSRELHDRVGQNLTALGINLDILRAQIESAAHERLRPRLEDSIALVEATADAIDDVMAELRPPLLDEQGLLPALRWYVKQFSQRTGIDVAVQGDARAPRPAPEIETTLFRIAQEALNNVAKHARATRVAIDCEAAAAEYRLIVHDNGLGFDPDELARGRGIATMRERAQSVGGTLAVRSARGGAGTQVTATIPRAR